MVDTVRSLASLQTLLADNVAGDIGAQDLRDFLVTALMQTSATTTVTTADITGAIGQVYNLDLSGLTANRSLILPAANVGDVIQVNVTTGDPDYELIIKGAATVTINDGTAATEWSRIFITGETVTLRATSSTNWHVVNDGRIPCCARLRRESVQLLTSAAYTEIQLNVQDYSVGVRDSIITYDMTIRRSGKYSIAGNVSLNISDTKVSQATIAINDVINSSPLSYTAPGRTTNSNSLVNYDFMLNYGDTLNLNVYHTNSVDTNTTSGSNSTYPWMAIKEIL